MHWNQTVRSVISLLGVVILGSVAALPARAATHALLVGSQGNGRIVRYNGQTGEPVNLFVPPGRGDLGSGCSDAPLGILVGPDGHLYVASGGAVDTVLRYDGLTGAFIDTFVTDGSGGLDQPASLAFGADGHLYVSSTETDSVLRYDGQTGAFIDTFIAPGVGGLDEPYGLVFGPDGNLYVCSAVMVEADVLRFDGQTGAFIDVFALGANFGLFENLALEFGPDGNLYVTSAHPGKVVRYDGQTGAPIGEFVSPGSGGLEDPTGLRFGPDGNLYLSEYAGNSVLRYDGQTGAPLPGPLANAGTAEFIPARSAGLSCPWDLVFVELPPPVCEPSDPPLPETIDLAGNPVSQKNRYLSVKAGQPGRVQAIRVKVLSQPSPYEVWNGVDLYVGKPHQVCENSSQGPEIPITECASIEGARDWNWYAPLLCNPNALHFTDWHGTCDVGTCDGGLKDGEGCTIDADCADVVHLYHQGIMPKGVYDIQFVDSSCQVMVDGNYSNPLSLTQAKWADIVQDCQGCPCGPPDNSVNVTTDVVAQLDKFQNKLCSVSMARADIQPDAQDFKITINEVLLSLNAFRGWPYPLTPGDPCSPS